MKRAARTKKRSTSNKRKKSHSRTVLEDDENTLVRMLNERAASDRDVLISKEQYDELKLANSKLKEAKARANLAENQLAELQLEHSQLTKENKKTKAELNSLQKQHEHDQVLIKELKLSTSKHNKELEEKEASRNAQQKQQAKALAKLRSSLADIEKLMNYRAISAKRHLNKATRVLTQHQRQLEDQALPKPTKNQFSKNLSELKEYFESVLEVLTNQEPEDYNQDAYCEQLEIENKRLQEEMTQLKESENITSKYKQTIERMREQIQVLKNRLSDLQSDENSKKEIEEKDNKISMLEKENELLNQHINYLQSSLNEQAGVIDHLKSVISSFSASPKASNGSYYIDSPKQPQDDYEEDQLRKEIDTLDDEIQQLQSSLQRALATH